MFRERSPPARFYYTQLVGSESTVTVPSMHKEHLPGLGSAYEARDLPTLVGPIPEASGHFGRALSRHFGKKRPTYLHHLSRLLSA
jgi:hypothetical protein